MCLRSLPLVVALVVTACAVAPSSPQSVSAPGDGRAILERACTVCHDLGGLVAFADFWDEPEWRSLIDTMVEYGATLTPVEYEVLAGYLADAF